MSARPSKKSGRSGVPGSFTRTSNTFPATSTPAKSSQSYSGAFDPYPTNTISAFALGDYEWLLPIESDDLTELVDLMRELRYTEARRHVREEVPFYTGRRITTAELVEVLQ